MRANSILACLLGAWLVLPGLAWAGWVDEVCEQHPKKEYCRATICEKLSQGCLRFAADSTGGSTRYVLTPYRGGAGGSDYKGKWLSDGPIVDTAGVDKATVDPSRLLADYARTHGKPALLATPISTDTTRITGQPLATRQTMTSADMEHAGKLIKKNQDLQKGPHGKFGDGTPFSTQQIEAMKNKQFPNKGMPPSR